MPVNDIFADFLRASALLSRVPLRADFSHRTASAAWAYPLVGLWLGLCGVFVGGLAFWVGLRAEAAAGLVLLAGIVLSGAMHEDGLADTADGLWGGWTPARRLEIMRDSRIGTYGVLALGLSLLLRFSALVVLLPVAPMAVVCAAIASRGAMVAVMHALPHARGDGLSRSTGHPSFEAAAIAVGIAMIAALCGSVWALVFGIAATVACARLARAKIAGQTGDILGATQQVVEITVLLTLAATLA